VGRSRKRPTRALADKAYSSKANQRYLREHKIQAVISVKEDQKEHRRNRGSAGGRPPNFDAERYKERNTVERCVNKPANTGRWPPDSTRCDAKSHAASELADWRFGFCRMRSSRQVLDACPHSGVRCW
jgi:transposase